MGVTRFRMQPDTSDGTCFHTFSALGAFFREQYDMTFPDQRVFRAHFYTGPVLAGKTDMDATDFRPTILNIDTRSFRTLHTRVMCSCTSQHAEPAIGAFAFFQHEHGRFSLDCTKTFRLSAIRRIIASSESKLYYIEVMPLLPTIFEHEYYKE